MLLRLLIEAVCRFFLALRIAGNFFQFFGVIGFGFFRIVRDKFRVTVFKVFYPEQ